MKMAYIALDPLRYPRIGKIACSVRKYGNIEFFVLIPKIRLKWQGNRLGRVLSAIFNYSLILVQIFFLKADIFWVANCPDILAFPLVLRRKRYILDYRSPWSIEVEQEFGSGPWVDLSLIFENIALKHACVVTLTTNKLSMKVKNLSKPIYVVPNYPSKNFEASVSRERFRRQSEVGDRKKVILFVGKLTVVEGADLLPKIIMHVLENGKNVLFWIVGDGPYLSLLSRLADKMPENVRLFGWQPYKTIPNFINASDVCIVPRHDSPFSMFYNEEGLQKISEFMFFNKPIVVCGIAESEEYLLVKESEMANGIIRALKGDAPLPNRKTWEEHSEKRIFEMLDSAYGMEYMNSTHT